jgi:hypothetical protein
MIVPTQPVEVINYKLRRHASDLTMLEVDAWEPVFRYAEDFKPTPGARYALHADLAIRSDRAGISMSHVSKLRENKVIVDEEQEDGTIKSAELVQLVPEVKNDFTISFEADLGAEPVREIQVRWVRQLVFDLIQRGFPIGLVSMDGFQSVDNLQTLALHGITTEKVSTDKDVDIWKSLKDTFYEGRLTLPFNEILLQELQALSKVGDKVDHPVGGSKDLADALACSVVGAMKIGGAEDTEGVPSFESGLDDFESGEPLPRLEGFEEFSLVDAGEEGWFG